MGENSATMDLVAAAVQRASGQEQSVQQEQQAQETTQEQSATEQAQEQQTTTVTEKQWWESVENPTEFLENANKYKEIAPKVTEYEEKLKGYEGYVKPANDYVKGLNDLLSSGADEGKIRAFQKVNTVAFDKLNPIDKVSLQLQLDKGWDEDRVQYELGKKYRLDPDVYTEDEVSDSKRQLQYDAQDAEKFLGDYKKNFEIPNPAKEQEQLELRAQENLRELDKIVPQFKFEGVKVGDLEFKPTDEFSRQLPEMTKNLMIQFGIPPTTEGLEKVRPAVEAAYKAASFENAVKHAADEREKAVRAEYNNPSRDRRGEEQGQITTDNQKIAQAILSMRK